MSEGKQKSIKLKVVKQNSFYKIWFKKRNFEQDSRPEVFYKKGVLKNFAKLTSQEHTQVSGLQLY